MSFLVMPEHDGSQWLLRFAEKGGNAREIPVLHDLEHYMPPVIGRCPDGACGDDGQLRSVALSRRVPYRYGVFSGGVS
jgi:hypothetical protein